MFLPNASAVAARWCLEGQRRLDLFELQLLGLCLLLFLLLSFTLLLPLFLLHHLAPLRIRLLLLLFFLFPPLLHLLLEHFCVRLVFFFPLSRSFGRCCVEHINHVGWCLCAREEHAIRLPDRA